MIGPFLGETMIGTMDFCLWYVDLLKREGHLEVTLNQLHAKKD